MKVGTKTQSTVQPDKFLVNSLPNGNFELSLCENVVELEHVTDVNGEELVETIYEYDLTLEIHKVKSYEELASALVSLKYSYGDEFALMRKGSSNEYDKEYVSYLSYVNDCKSFAKQYWFSK